MTAGASGKQWAVLTQTMPTVRTTVEHYNIEGASERASNSYNKVFRVIHVRDASNSEIWTPLQIRICVSFNVQTLTRNMA